MSTYIHASTGGAAGSFQIESEFQTSRVVATSRTGVRLTGAGLAAVVAALNTYYSGLSATQKASLSTAWHVTIGASGVTASVAPGTETTLANGLITALSGAGNTAVG